MKNLWIITLAMATLINCNGQTKTIKNATNKKVAVKEKSEDEIKPDIKIKVNKTYDRDGNIIGYDSVYSYTYKYPNGKIGEFEADSVVKSFRKAFGDEFFSDFNNTLFDNMFSNDSLFFHNFLSEDYFMDQLRNDNNMFERLMSHMDSMKNEFIRHNYSLEPKMGEQNTSK